MLTQDIYGKTFSNSFLSSISAYSQVVKPRIVIDLLDSRHISLTSNITNTDSYSNISSGSRGFFFSEKQMINGPERESFVWGVTDCKLKDGSVIKADGSCFAMPANLEDGYEYGYWTNTKSESNGVFASSPVITFNFEERKINKLRITTSETLGQVKSLNIKVVNANIGYIYDNTLTFDNDEYFKEVYIKTNEAIISEYNASQVILTILSTKNSQDCGRIHEINCIYEEDITDRVDNFSVSRTRDVHESNVPIGGSQNPKINIRIDNTDKAWNLLNTSSAYGKYMKKDLKVSVAAGWRIIKTDDVLSSTELRSNISNSSLSLDVVSTDIFPEGGINNYFLVTIDPDNEKREIVLCEQVQGTYTVSVISRGFANTTPQSHDTGAVVQFDPYEYVPMGTYYVDEWSASSSDMSVNITASDWGKFLNEKTITKGFMLQNTTMGDAVKNLILRSNFPNKKIQYLKPYTKDAVDKGSIALYSFNEEIIDRSGNILKLNAGLRMRLWGMRSGSEYLVKDIVADALERELSKEEIANGVSSYISPDLTAVTSDISGNTYGSNASLSLQDYSFTGNNSITYRRYFNGVVDGYYIPLQNGQQNIELDITNGGARIYLDDTLIAENWNNNKSLKTLSAYEYLGNLLNLQAGVPYKIRIEFFHADGDANFRIHLYKNNASLNNRQLILDTETTTTVAKDKLGCLDASSNTALPNFNHHYNDGIYYSNVEIGEESFINEYGQKSVFLVNDGYIRIPYNSVIGVDEKDFSYEVIARFNQGSFDNNGEYISSWSNSSPSNGFEFYYSNSNTHGFKVITSNGVESVGVSNVALNSSDFYHIVATYKSDSKKLTYYINGNAVANTTVVGNIIAQSYDITIGGRGASFTADSGPNAPSVFREFYIDEMAIYSKTLSSADVKDRYISSTLQELTVFQFLYDNTNSIRQTIDTITLADLGRFYIDETDTARYEHYYRFFEPEIDQHANVQYLFSDNLNIVSADYQVQLQTNKVVVKVSSVDIAAIGTQSLWRADDPTTFASVTLLEELAANATSMYVSTTSDPPFFNNGYVVIDNEIIKYTGKTDNQFLSLERGQFDTQPSLHTVNSNVREARYYDITYEKAPAYMIKSPFITAINDEDPSLIDILKFEPGAYTGRLILSASNNVPSNSIVYAEGTNPLTEKVYFTAVAGIPVNVSQSTQQISEQVESSDDNIRMYGLKELVIESPYITDVSHAEKIAQFIIQKTKEPVPILNLDILAVPTVQLGDRIRIQSMNSFDIINGDYWIISQEFAYGNGIMHNLTLRKVS